MHIAPLKDNSTLFDAFYSIYRVSFPPSEQKSKEALLAMLTSTSYTIFVTQNDEEILGFCIMFHEQTLDFYLLEYMAMATEKRGLGLGSRLLIAAIKHLHITYGLKPLLIEIDSTEKPSEEQQIREKREHFYRKLGCKKIDPFDYILPLKSNETPPPMELLLHHSTLNCVTKQTLKSWLEQLYTKVYGCEANDTRIRTMLHNAPERFDLI